MIKFKLSKTRKTLTLMGSIVNSIIIPKYLGNTAGPIEQVKLIVAVTIKNL